MKHTIPYLALALACAVSLSPRLASSVPAVRAGDVIHTSSEDPLRSVQYRECSQRAGPYATQTTAWQRWRQARSQGYAVSEGVFPCYDGYGTRGYCFNVFYRC